MSNARKTDAELGPLQSNRAEKRVILSMGGKGVSKTTAITGLAEWFDLNQIPVKLLDLEPRTRRGDR